MTSLIGLAEITAARARIAPLIRATPVEPSAALGALTGHRVDLKFEHHQHTGSFKFRGASHAVARLGPEAQAAGVVGVSTGNHGRGLARACAQAGLRCVIAMSELVPANKVAAIRAEGAEVLIEGRSQDAAQKAVDALVAEGMVMIPPFDHPDIIAGQGTLGLEMAEARPDLGTVLIPLSGGGLISGVAAALRAQRPGIRIIGVSMARGAAMQASLAAGHPVEVVEEPTLADSLGGGIGLDNRHTFAMVRDLVDEVVLLSESEIAAGIRHCYAVERQVVEGSGAVGVAALLAGKGRLEGPVMALLSGCNIAMDLHRRVISGEEVDVALEDA